jgi:hypothetical protein
MENKQTALQGFIEALTSNGYVIINQTLIDTYLEMEKQQIINAYDQDLYGGLDGYRKFENGEQYYNETYNK